jgi:methyltransferase (TIGR00027 family)
MRRAAHQIFDRPRVLEDPLAVPIIGPEAAAKLASGEQRYGQRIGRSIRAFMAARSRYAEDQLALAIARGTRQYVILGAGLDTFAYRNPYLSEALRVYEVDYPATQEWKRQKLAKASIPIPPSVIHAPVDFERQTLADGLAKARFDMKAAAFFSWLGVVMYLTEEATMSTLALIASTPPGGGVVFDFAVPRESLSWMGRLALDAISRRVAGAGEPFRTFFEPQALSEKLTAIGFHSVQTVGAEEINARYFADREDELRVSGNVGRLMKAQV